MEGPVKYLADVTTLKYDAGKCAGCGRCVEVCPRAVFEMQNKRAVITDRDLCMECGACAGNCEFGALTVNAGVGCATAIINGMITGGEPTCGCSDKGSCCG
jgi:NAD-dependent dihydropyrimidine dehydrogenase PreA subunit